MSYEVALPDGRVVEFPDNVPREQAARIIQQQLGASPAGPKTPPKTGLLAAIGKGAESTFDATVAGGKALFGDATRAADELNAAQERVAQKYAEQTSLDKVKDAYNKDGVLSAAGEVLRQVPYALAEQAPNIAAAVGAGKLGALGGARLGAMAGASFGLPGAVIGGGLGALAASALPQLGGNLARQREAAPTQEVSMGAAVPTALAQGALDVASMAIPLGRTVVGKVLGPEVQAALAAGNKKAAETLAKESIPKLLTKGTAIGVAAETPTEVLQQVLERAQAGLPLTSDDALSEYAKTAYGSALLGPVGAAGRYVDRSAARSGIDAQKAKDAADAKVQAIRDREAQMKDPAYATQVLQEYQTQLDVRKQMIAALPPKPGKGADADPAAKIAWRQATNAIRKFEEETLAPLAIKANAARQVLGKNAPPPAPAPATPAAPPEAPGASADYLESWLTGEAPTKDPVAPTPQADDLEQFLTAGFTAPPPPAAPTSGALVAQRLTQEYDRARPGQNLIEGLTGERVDEDLAAKSNFLTTRGVELVRQDPALTSQVLQSKGTVLEGLTPQAQRGIYDALREQVKQTAQAQQEDLKRAAQAPAQQPTDPFVQEQLGALDQRMAAQEDLQAQQEKREARTQANDLYRQLFGEQDLEEGVRDPGIKGIRSVRTPATPETLGVPVRRTAPATASQELVGTQKSLPVPTQRADVEQRVQETLKLYPNLTPAQSEAFAQHLRNKYAAPETERDALAQKLEEVLQRQDLLPEARAAFERLLRNMPYQPHQLENVARAVYQLETQGWGLVPGRRMQSPITMRTDTPAGTVQPATAAVGPKGEFRARREDETQEAYEKAVARSSAGAQATAGKQTGTDSQAATTTPAVSRMERTRAPLVDDTGRAVTRTLVNTEGLPAELTGISSAEDVADQYRSAQATTLGQDKADRRRGKGVSSPPLPPAVEGVRRANYSEQRSAATRADDRSGKLRARNTGPAPDYQTADDLRAREEAAGADTSGQESVQGQLFEDERRVATETAQAFREIFQITDQDALLELLGERSGVVVQPPSKVGRDKAGQMRVVHQKGRQLPPDAEILKRIESARGDKLRAAMRRSIEAAETQKEREFAEQFYANIVPFIENLESLEAALKEQSASAVQSVEEIAKLQESLVQVKAAELAFYEAMSDAVRNPDITPAQAKTLYEDLRASMYAAVDKLRPVLQPVAQGARRSEWYMERMHQMQPMLQMAQQVLQESPGTQQASDAFAAALSEASALLAVYDVGLFDRKTSIESGLQLIQAQLDAGLAQLDVYDNDMQALRSIAQLEQLREQAPTAEAIDNIQLQLLEARERYDASVKKAQKTLEDLKDAREEFRKYERASDEAKRLGRKRSPTAVEDTERRLLNEQLDAEQRQRDSLPPERGEVYEKRGYVAGAPLEELVQARKDALAAGVTQQELDALEKRAAKKNNFIGLNREVGKIESAMRKLEAVVRNMRTQQKEANVPKALKSRLDAKQAEMDDLDAQINNAGATLPKEAQRSLLEKYQKARAERDVVQAQIDLAVAQRTSSGKAVFKGMGDILRRQALMSFDLALKRQRLDELESLAARGKDMLAEGVRQTKAQEAAAKQAALDAEAEERTARNAARPQPGAPVNPFEAAKAVWAPLPKNMSRGDAKAEVEAEKPSTSGEALTRSEARKAAKPQKTQYAGKSSVEDVEALEKATAEADTERRKKGLGPVPSTQRMGPRTTASVREELNAEFPVDEGTFSDRVEVYASPEDFQKQNPEYKGEDPADARGMVWNNRAILFANNIPAGSASAVLLHELGVHIGFNRIFTPQQLDALYNAVKKWASMKGDSVEAQVGRAVTQRLMDAGLQGNDAAIRQEAVAYAAEAAREMGVKPATGGPVGAWLQRVKDAFEKALQKFFGAAKQPKLTAQQLVDMAYGAANMELRHEGPQGPDGGGSKDVLFSKKPKFDDPKLAALHEDLGKAVVAQEDGFGAQVKRNLLGLVGLHGKQQFVDSLASMQEVSRYIAKEQGDSFRAAQMMYNMRMHGYKSHLMGQAVTVGAPVIERSTAENGRDQFIVTAKEGANLQEIAGMLSRTPGMNADGANEMYALHRIIKRADNVGLDKMNYMQDANGNPLVTRDMIEDAKKTMKATPGLMDHFADVDALYDQYNRDLINFAVQTGVISKTRAAQLVANDDYVPFYRKRGDHIELVVGGKEDPIRIGNIREQPYLQELVGGDQKILPFLTSTLQNTNLLLDMSLRNLAARSAANELDALGMATIGGPKQAGPDVFHFYSKGELKSAKVDTDEIGVPSELLVKGMAGIPMTQFAALKLLGVPARLLRQAVTLSPVYAARQLFRDPVATNFTAGSNAIPVVAQLKAWGSENRKTLEKRGLTGGMVYTGTNEDMLKLLRDAQQDKSMGMKLLQKLESLSMAADATTRTTVYESAKKQGLSDMEAGLQAMESMNFSKRGMSPSMHFLSTMIPFFNAQIQGLNVLYEAMTGKGHFNDQLKIRQKFYKRGMMLMAGTLAYAALMSDEEEYKNALPEERYNNWFVRVPGVDQMVRIPIPFEPGIIFKALPELMTNVLNDTEDGRTAVKVLSTIMKNMIPGGSSMLDVKGIPVPVPIPQALKPAIEASLGKSFFTGRDLESGHEKQLDPERRFREQTTELAKFLGSAGGFSPLVIDHLIRGYGSTTGLLLAQMLSSAIPVEGSPEKVAKRLSDYPVLGSLFQPKDAAGIINYTYERMQEFERAKKTFDDMVKSGNRAEATRYLQENAEKIAQAGVAGNFTQVMGKLAQYKKAVMAAQNMSSEEKRRLIDAIRAQEIKLASAVRERVRERGKT